MTISALTPSKVATTRIRKKPYIIHDKKLKGFYLKVYPSGRKTFGINVRRGGKRYDERIGHAAEITIKEARKIAANKIDALTLTTTKASPLMNTAFSAMAEVVFSRYERRWKPSTIAVNRYYLKNQILPFFGEKDVASITRADVEIWFSKLSHISETANRAAPVLSTIMQGAEELGLRPEDSNPVIGLKRYKRYPRQCVLSVAEMARLGRLLDAVADTKPLHTAMLRLIILTGCRKGEIMQLRWRDYRGGNLHLIDSKTGPKMVFLSPQARAILDGLKTKRSTFIFPSPSGKPFTSLQDFWFKLRSAAKLDRLRLHDFRHHYASIAIRNGESISAIGRLLGHNQPGTTLRYAHLDDVMMHQAVGQITASMVNHGGGIT